MADEIRRLSEELARDPGSLAFLQLGELLRRARDLRTAASVAARGRERHPGLAAAHDLVARISADSGDLPAAAEAWRSALRITPTHAGANKGLGFIAYREGRLREAGDHLALAVSSNPDDTSAVRALEKVRGELAALPAARPSVTPAARLAAIPPEAPRRSDIGVSVFGDIANASETVLLVDHDGLVMAGSVPIHGVDRGNDIAAHLTGVSDEASRAMRHLDLGEWTALVVESQLAAVAMAPAGTGAVVVVSAPRSTPLGLVRRQMTRAADRARAWLGEGA